MNVLARDVREEYLIPMWLRVQDEKHLVLASLPLAAQEEAEFKRHIEPGQIVPRVQVHGGNIVDPAIALFDDALILRKPHFAGIIFFPCGACHEDLIAWVSQASAVGQALAGRG